jgi:AraC-like DNA-binding protein
VQTPTMPQRILEMVRQRVLPFLKDEALARVVFTEPPFHFPPGIEITYNRGKALTAQSADPPYSSDLTHNWAHLNLHSARYSCLGFVVEGSIDWRIGVTTRMTKSGVKELSHSESYDLALPTGTFFLMPPGVPYVSGDHDHWSRSVAQGKDIKVLWVQFHRYGMQCYLGHTENGEYIREAYLYIPESRSIVAIETLVDELRLREQSSSELVNTLLLYIYQLLAHGLQSGLGENTDFVVPSASTSASANDIVEQACAYIDSHFHAKINLDGVAAHVFISPSYLTRLFRAEKGMSINEYITQVRLDYACNMLAKSDLRVNHIGKISGYRNHSYFCQLFLRRMGCSPLQYRMNLKTKSSPQ